MQSTRLVVIMAAVGENVLWELTQATKIADPQQLLILVLKMKADDYESFRTKATPILGVSLPARAPSWRFGRVSGFISFAADWKPSFLPLKAPYFRGGNFKTRAKYALRPVFERFGLEWQLPPVRVSQILLLISSIFVGVLVAFALVVFWLAFVA
jgi:hypothetical protein